jgi:uncharacterized spore protein YtfJ
MNITDFTSKIKELLSQVGGVNVSFGEAKTVDGVTVIPVAKVMIGGGGGEGGSTGRRKGKKPAQQTETETTEEGKKPEDYGVGMGGGATTVPLGVFAITDGKVAFHPVVTIEKVFGFGLLFLIVLLRFVRKQRK